MKKIKQAKPGTEETVAMVIALKQVTDMVLPVPHWPYFSYTQKMGHAGNLVTTGFRYYFLTNHSSQPQLPTHPFSI